MATKLQPVELGRIKVDGAIANGLKRLSEQTGAPMQYHRRKAYEEYLKRTKA